MNEGDLDIALMLNLLFNEDSFSRKQFNMNFNRITVNPKQMDGVPCIRGLRIPVATVISMVAEGMSQADILTYFPDLEAEDIKQALLYAAEAVRERELPLVTR